MRHLVKQRQIGTIGMGRPRKYPILNGPVNELIFAAMRRDGISKPNEWADKWGIGRTALRTAMVGRQSQAGTWVRPDIRTLWRLARALDVPLVYLIERFYDDLENADALWPQVPIVGWVGAGSGSEEDIQEKYVPVDMELALRGHVVAFKVRGNSMCAGPKPICDGDVIIVDCQNKGRVGSRVVARLADGSYVCKLLKHGPTGNFLVSANPSSDNSYPDVIPASSVEEIVGKVLEVRSSDSA